jgi:hypothetical protein
MLTGTDANNYNLIDPTGLTATINKANLTVGGISASDKTYDTTTSATLSGTASVTALGSDVVSVTGTGWVRSSTRMRAATRPSR